MSEHEKERAESEKDAREASNRVRKPKLAKQAPGEVGGPEGPETTRYGDWERNGRVSDF